VVALPAVASDIAPQQRMEKAVQPAPAAAAIYSAITQLVMAIALSHFAATIDTVDGDMRATSADVTQALRSRPSWPRSPPRLSPSKLRLCMRRSP